MPRVCRHYQHEDFSYLLTPQPDSASPEIQQPKPAPVVSPEKRRRDSLMSRRSMRYAIDPSGVIHDRDCPHVADIPDKDFSMCEDFPNGKSVCFTCYRKALIRKGLDLNLTRHMPMVLNVFSRMKANNHDLTLLFIEHNAFIYKIEPDCVYLKVREDRWMVQVSEYGCILYHNNYRKISETQRVMEDDFHLQTITPVMFQAAVSIMGRYVWNKHVQFEEKTKRPQRQISLKKQLEHVCCYRLLGRPSILFQYFQMAVPKDFSDKLPCKIIEAETYGVCQLLLCRVFRWNAKDIPAMASTIQTRCLNAEDFNYINFCKRMFPRSRKRPYDTPAPKKTQEPVSMTKS